MNKKAMSIIPMFLFVLGIFFLILFLGMALWGFNLINDVLDQDIAVGQVNLQDVNNQSFGQINQGFVNNVDLIGVILIFGLILMMILNAFFVGANYPKLFLIVDIFLLVFVFIIAVYMAQTYETFINSSPLFDFFKDDMTKTSKFMLNLPGIVAIIGVIIMIVSYAGLNRLNQMGETDVYGY